MSKKKSKVSLKDFHGGSIPSDLPLPSAPGVIVRPSNHVGFDRQTAWGNSMGRSDHRLRPGSAGAVRTFDDKTPFLSHTGPIGRNFDEDERKPLDGVSAPRRTVSDDSIRGGPPVRNEPRRDYPSVTNRPATTPVPQLSSGAGSSYAVRFTEGANVGVNSQNVGSGSRSYNATRSEGRAGNVNIGGGSTGPSPNAWGLRKDAVGVSEPVASSWSAPDAASKLAHASALEKVSSGRWHSKQHSQIDVEVIRHAEPEDDMLSRGNMYNKSTYNSTEVYDATLARHADRSLSVDDGTPVGARELPTYEKSRSFVRQDVKEKNPSVYVDGTQAQPPRNVSTISGAELQRPVSSESSERPKLKLLPRSKPVDNLVEPPVGNKQAYLRQNDPDLLETRSEKHGNENPIMHGSTETEGVNQSVERPKLNLRPRTQPLEQSERTTERERSTLFGGARPRELVLKERGVDDVVVNNHDLVPSPSRTKQDTPRADHVAPARQNGKTESIPLDLRTGKNVDRRDNRAETEKAEGQRRSWRNENRRSSRDLEKQQQHQQVQERPPSPETWRKPAQQPAPSPGPRYGKAASAVELAQAFSRSVSDPKIGDRISGQRGLPGQVQIPFSRLTGQPSRPQINGY